MKKLTNLSIATFTLLLVSTMAFAQPGNRQRRNKATKVTPKPVIVAKAPAKKPNRGGLWEGNINRNRVYTYQSVQYVNVKRGVRKKTYLHKIFPNGRQDVSLLNTVLVKRNYTRNRTSYVSQVETYGHRTYIMTYSISRGWFGFQTKQIVSKELVHTGRIG